ncbi:MAG: bifunctional diaminohydroxyphosphoribosylaminopyrimidine deaminase/5-amino-6-(5-phosphoribosylamino)uracil reductase RibD [Nocardioides sp.]
MGFTDSERAAMRRALELAATAGVPLGPNPRVGCVLLADDGGEVAEGFHRGAGGPHAEADALREAGDAARGATAVVTLEPCDHRGRTGPCTQALIAAGVRRVVFAQTDTNPVAHGGGATLRAAGIEVEGGLLADEARRLNRAWTFALEHGRPFVTWKFATTLDGRSAAADGTSRWLSSSAARRDTHRLRSLCDAILVGSNTVEVDDPELTVRDEYGDPLPRQLLRVVMGKRDLDPSRRVFDDRAETLRMRSHDPREVLDVLHTRDCQHLFLEGGPTVAGAFLRAGLVDEVVAYVAPMLLGAGRAAVDDLGITTIAEALHLRVTDVAVLEDHDGGDDNVRITMSPKETT